ncbi:peptide-methionine (S)-S-oxide reductase MsrA [Lewinella cohaerens]|uniref:peptide-methionine (S)-S-oxide reductase MsrA n=1 Tax=Lewinella cohaerens TaxID=70995 RepID=UPI00037FFAA9|nr:peptide-methionine (S)-S-oxide reductase MsrA [Lewinella cohaerens]
MSNQLALATLGGGCFWCVEAIFEQVEGVHAVMSGYSGGDKATADYKTVCSGTTKHAEVVQVSFDPSVTSYQEILEIFFTTHDPTTPNRQGNDVGPQYRSVVFYHDEAQKAIAEETKADYAPKVWDSPIVTEIAPFEELFPAEEYHHGYYSKVGERNPYCTFVITPKVSKFRKLFSHKMKVKS